MLAESISHGRLAKRPCSKKQSYCIMPRWQYSLHGCLAESATPCIHRGRLGLLNKEPITTLKWRRCSAKPTRVQFEVRILSSRCRPSTEYKSLMTDYIIQSSPIKRQKSLGRRLCLLWLVLLCVEILRSTRHIGHSVQWKEKLDLADLSSHRRHDLCVGVTEVRITSIFGWCLSQFRCSHCDGMSIS
jgi:hypothetical protein